ncbi:MULTISPECIES: DeoR/GlpR family DNA-binding transcription regulator [Paenibacillus]|uniref:DeoR/GlpR family DNA-binding transcription regulator n=1 Tax=Paenibacillus TaxID=44249 RepID=UPI0022B92C64|nr:DeoR/GlpR family DNA-binding transcription regulator [Paenibacillus caseinilyticus]MCZ8519207.1 DeoR/GlpR family DNA-binding transcription regulator [Paenibacillus caseinilyticus]
MTAIKRYEKIMELLMAHGEVSVADLAARLEVTGKTIRQDLEKLEEKGLLHRTHGGAVLANEGYSGLLGSQPATGRHSDEKHGTAVAALRFVERGDIIALDSGSTTLEMARMLDNAPLTVITNDLYIIAELIKKDQIRLVVPGGFRSRNMLVSEEAGAFLRRLNVQKAFLSTTGIHTEYGFTVFTHSHVEQKRAMIASAKEAFCVADHSKFDKAALMTFAKLGEIGTIVTDEGLAEDTAARYAAAGVRIQRG